MRFNPFIGFDIPNLLLTCETTYIRAIDASCILMISTKYFTQGCQKQIKQRDKHGGDSHILAHEEEVGIHGFESPQ